MNTPLQGMTALITGGGTGIGQAIALGMAAEGANIVVNYSRSEAESLDTVKQIEACGAEAIAVRADVTQVDAVRGLVDSAVAAFDRVDILVNNAGGVFGKQPIWEMPEDVWDRTMALNLKAVFLLSKALIPQLPDGKGRIINVTSISAFSGKGGAAYGPAKAGVVAMTRDMANVLGARGITANGIAPGIIDTRIHREGTPPDEYKALIDRIPVGRDGKVEDVAGIAVFLASEAGGFISGETIHVNGGMLMV